MKIKLQKIVVVGFIIHDGKLLIVKRSSKAKFLPNYYELPGGHVEFGEEPKEALKREIKEELGVDVTIFEPFHYFSYFSDEGNVHNIEIAFFAKVNESVKNIKLNEHEDIRWVTKNELDSYKISDKEKETMKKGFEIIYSKVRK